MNRQQHFMSPARVAAMILTPLLFVPWAQGAERQFVPGQDVTVVKVLTASDNYHMTLGFGKLDSKIGNMGYFAYEQQGQWSALGSGAGANSGASMRRLAVKGEAFDDPQQPYENWVQGVKFDLFVSENKVGTTYQWQGAGVGMGLVISPLGPNISMHLTLGGDFSPAFARFNSAGAADYQWNSYQELEYFFTDRLGVTLRHTRLSTGKDFALERKDDQLWVGVRLMF